MPSTNIIVTLCEIGIWWYDSIAKTPNIDSIFHRRYHRQLCPFIQKTQTCPQSFHRLSDRYEDVTEGEPVHYVQKDEGARENYSGNAVLKKRWNCIIILWWILCKFGKNYSYFLQCKSPVLFFSSWFLLYQHLPPPLLFPVEKLKKKNCIYVLNFLILVVMVISSWRWWSLVESRAKL